METQILTETGNKKVREDAVNRRLDAIGWAAFLILTGSLWLAPEGSVPKGLWLIGIGIIIVGMDLYRYMNKIKVSGCWTFCGAIALGCGLCEHYELAVPVFPIIMTLAGISILYRMAVDRKAEKGNRA